MQKDNGVNPTIRLITCMAVRSKLNEQLLSALIGLGIEIAKRDEQSKQLTLTKTR